MYRIAAVVACLACAGHGQRGRRPLQGLDGAVQNPVEMLARLLVASTPGTAFKSAGPGAVALSRRHRASSPSMGFENPSLLTFSKKGEVTMGLGPEMKPTEVHLEPTFQEGTPVYGAVAVPLPMGMVFEESARFEGRFEIFQVAPKTNAAKAGLRPGDVIRAASASSAEGQSVFNADNQKFDDLMDAIKSNSDNGHAVLVIERDVAPKGRLTVCTKGMTCKGLKGFSSADAVAMLRAMASTHKGIALKNEEHLAEKPAAELQEQFSQELVKGSKCFNRCGRGISIYNSAFDEVDKEIINVPSGLTILKSLGLDIPTATSIAYLRRENARKLIEMNQLEEALGLMGDSIKAATTLGVQGALLTMLLYESRADLHEQMGNEDAAQEDRAKAESMLELKYPVAA